MKKVITSISLLIAIFAAPTYAETFGNVEIINHYNPNSGNTRVELIATAVTSRDENSPQEAHYPRIYIDMNDYDGGYIHITAFGTNGGHFSCFVTANGQSEERFKSMQNIANAFANGSTIYVSSYDHMTQCSGMRLVKSDRYHLN